MTPIAQDETFKAGAHGLLLGCVLPVLAYNLMRRNTMNSAIYLGLMLFEVRQILGHLDAAGRHD